MTKDERLDDASVSARLSAFIDEMVKAFRNLSAEQQAKIYEEQKASWIRGEIGFDSYGGTRTKK